MAEGRRQHDWGQTASVMCLLANLNRDPKKTKALTPADFMPGPKKKPEVKPATPADMERLKAMFSRKGKC